MSESSISELAEFFKNKANGRLDEHSNLVGRRIVTLDDSILFTQPEARLSSQGTGIITTMANGWL